MMSDASAPLGRPRVLFDLRWVRGARPDGIARYSIELFRHLGLLDPEREYFALYGGGAVRGGPLDAIDPRALLVSPHGLFSPRSRGFLAGLLRRGRFRFYLAPNYLGFPPGRAPGTIRIAVVHDLIPWELPEARAGGLRWRLFYRFPPAGRYLLRTAPDRLVAVSEATRAAIVRRFGGESERIAVVPGAPSPRFGPKGEDDERLLAALGLPRPYLLYVGRKDAHKNLGRLVEAHRALPGPMRRRFPLVIAGADIPAGPGLLSIPRVDDEVLPSLYRAATLLVLPSLAEGFGLTMVEAFACGTPALASRISPLVEHGGRAARYFDPRDAGEMARVMRETLEDEAALRAMRAAAREQASLFSWEKSASVMKELLRTLDSGQ